MWPDRKGCSVSASRERCVCVVFLSPVCACSTLLMFCTCRVCPVYVFVGFLLSVYI